MKFGEQLGTHLTPEWRTRYIEYEEMKQMIYDTVAELPSAEDDPQGRERAIARADEKFFALCDQQLIRMGDFFKMKLADAEANHNELQRELETVLKATKKSSGKSKERLTDGGSSKTQHTKSLQQIKFAFSEFYLSLVLIQNYQALNSTGFRKILKKHDKLFENQRGLEYRQNHVEKSHMMTNNDVEKMIEQVEDAYTNKLESGNRAVAMKRLRVPPLSERQSAWTTFRLGFFFGCFIILSALVLTFFVTGTYDNNRPDEPKWVGVRLFRGFLILFANIWLMGLNVYGWQANGVNHVLIFEIDPRNHLTYQSLMEVASFFCMLWALSVLGYVYVPTVYSSIPALAFPLSLMIFCILWLFNPLNIPDSLFHRSSRSWILKHVWHCFAAPFYAVSFADFWLADQMNSLVTFFLDMQYFACFYIFQVSWSADTLLQAIPYAPMNATMQTSAWDVNVGIDYATGKDTCGSNVYGIRSLVSLIPATIRFLQCLRRFRDTGEKHPHLTNAGKYSTSYFVVLFGVLNSWYRKENDSGNVDSPLFYPWVLAYFIAFCYTLSWDILMDWGLFDKSAPPSQRFLRDEIIYSNKWYYYFACVNDAVLRLTWTINISLGDRWSAHSDLISCVTSLFECWRRFVWNFLRLENEHVNNCGNFRAVRDISLNPLRKGDLDGMLQRMDQLEGVTHRGAELSDKVGLLKRRKKDGHKKPEGGAVVRALRKLSKQPSRAIRSSPAVGNVPTTIQEIPDDSVDTDSYDTITKPLSARDYEKHVDA